MKIMVVAPHPDDEIIGVGGVISREAKRGNDVYIVTVTRGDSKFYSDEYIKEGRSQQQIADKMLGVKKIYYLDLKTPLLDTVPYNSIIKAIQEVFIDVNPNIVYIPHYGDIHIEHRIVSDCCMVALRPKEFKDICIYGYEVLSETGWNVPAQHTEFIPNVYERLSSDDAMKKIEALSIFSSQMNAYPSARSVEAITNMLKYRGSIVGTEFAEAFTLIRLQRS